MLLFVYVLRRRRLSQSEELTKRDLLSASPSTSNEASRSGNSVQLSTLRSHELKSVADSLVSNAKPTSYGAAAVAHSLAAEQEAYQERVQALIRAKVAAKVRQHAEEQRVQQENESSVVRVDDLGKEDGSNEGSMVKHEPEDTDGIPLHSVHIHSTPAIAQTAFRPQTSPFNRPTINPQRSPPFTSATSTARPTRSPLMNPAYRPPPPMANPVTNLPSPSMTATNPSALISPAPRPAFNPPSPSSSPPQPLFQLRQPSRTNFGQPR